MSLLMRQFREVIVMCLACPIRIFPTVAGIDARRARALLFVRLFSVQGGDEQIRAFVHSTGDRLLCMAADVLATRT